MKKPMNTIRNFFSGIWRLIDNFIVVPITKGILLITNKFDKSSKRIENWLSKPNTLLFISLIVAVGVFIIVDQKILKIEESSAEVLKQQPVTAIFNEEAYVIEGLPETVDVTLIGSKANLYFAKQASSHDITVDLSDLKPGSHKVTIKYNQELPSIKYTVNPSVANVTIYPKISETKTLTTDILNQDKLDEKLVIKNVSIANDKVVIKGAEQSLKKVATVKALVDINNLLKQEVGITTLKDIPLKAYDERGNAIDVEIVPNKINADIEIASPSKELPIQVIPKGEVSFGLAISAIELSETKVTVYGSEEVLEDLKSIPLEVDVTNLKEDHQYKLELTTPVGIKSMSIKNVTVQVSLQKTADKELTGIHIDPRNLKEGYTAEGVTEEDTTISVILKGVASVLEQITAKDIVAYVDLNGLSEGVHEVDVEVIGDDVKVQYLPKTKKVRIRIYKN